MTEQQMPAKFRITWKDGRYFVSIPNYEGGEVVRSDLAERMAEALEDWLNYAEDNISEFDLEECFADAETTLCPRCRSNGCIKQKFDAARDALSAFRSATQDTEANR